MRNHFGLPISILTTAKFSKNMILEIVSLRYQKSGSAPSTKDGGEWNFLFLVDLKTATYFNIL